MEQNQQFFPGLSIKARAKKSFLAGLNKTWNLVILIASMTIAFYAGLNYDKVSDGLNPKKDKFPQTKGRTTVSVSVNDRGELVFMDREENKITIYNDTIGMIIYDYYSLHFPKK